MKTCFLLICIILSDFLFSQQYVWKVSHPELKTEHFILGSYHSDFSGEIAFTDSLIQLFLSTEICFFESDGGSADGESMISNKRVTDFLNEKQNQLLEDKLVSTLLFLQKEQLVQIQPFYLVVLLEMKELDIDVQKTIDNQLKKLGVLSNKPTRFLESNQEINDRISSWEYDDQIEFLIHYLESEKDQGENPYLMGDESKLQEELFSTTRTTSKFRELFIHQRDALFASRMIQYYKKDSLSSFATIGIGHMLASKENVLDLMKEEGFILEQMQFDTFFQMDKRRTKVNEEWNIKSEVDHPFYARSINDLELKENRFELVYTDDGNKVEDSLQILIIKNQFELQETLSLNKNFAKEASLKIYRNKEGGLKLARLEMHFFDQQINVFIKAKTKANILDRLGTFELVPSGIKFTFTIIDEKGKPIKKGKISPYEKEEDLFSLFKRSFWFNEGRFSLQYNENSSIGLSFTAKGKCEKQIWVNLENFTHEQFFFGIEAEAEITLEKGRKYCVEKKEWKIEVEK